MRFLNNSSTRRQMMTITTTVSPPEIRYKLNPGLLKASDMKSPEDMRKKLLRLAEKRYNTNSRNMRDLEILLNSYEEIYEWKKAKKAYDEAAKKELLERPCLSPETVHIFKGELGKSLRAFFRISSNPVLKNNHEIQKI